MQVICDTETNGLENPTRIWCAVVKNISTREVTVFNEEDLLSGRFGEFSRKVTVWYGANFLTFDVPVLNRLAKGTSIDTRRVVDLQVISRTVNYGRPGGHSVENFAKKYGLHKPEIDVYDDPSRVSDYINRCTEDVEITYRMYLEFKRFIEDKDWSKAFRCEHDMALVCMDMHENGFPFDSKSAKAYLKEIERRLEVLTNEIVSDIGDVIDKEQTYTLRRKQDGTPFLTSLKVLGGLDTGFKDGDTHRVVIYRPFNPGSVKDRIEYLNSIGWKPFVKTKTHIAAERELRSASKAGNTEEVSKQTERLANLRVTGWKTNEDNLATLPPDAPEGARKLAQWLTLDARRGDLVEWLDAVREDTGRIHGKFWHIGAWTHRMSHSAPNQANIFGIPHLVDGEVPSPVKLIKLDWDKRLRALWTASKGKVLIGTDLEGIQLRILAHYMEDEAYTKAVAEGDKKLGTDVHNVNRQALGLNHITRDIAKTFKQGRL